MTIDEIIEQSTDRKVNLTKGPYYSNKAGGGLVREDREYMDFKQNKRGNEKDSQCKRENKLTLEYISATEFPTTYRRYVASGIGTKSLFYIISSCK